MVADRCREFVFGDDVGQLQGSQHVIDSQEQREYNRREFAEGRDCLS